jgi:hypothetical protein
LNAATLRAGGPLPEGFSTTQNAEFERQDYVAFVSDGPQERMLRGIIHFGSAAR